MRIFDPHVHMTSRTTDDYAAMRDAGIVAIVEPSFWLGQPRTSPDSFVDYFDSLLGWEPFRASQFGIRHHTTLALNPKEANDPRLWPVIDLLPRYLPKDGVVAVGEIGYDSMTPEEDEALARQLQLAKAHDLPALVHTPHRDKLAGTRRTLDVVRESGIAPERILIDHNNELSVAVVADSGCWIGFSIYPNTKMDEDRMARVVHEYGTERILIDSAADWGVSDPLKTRKTADYLLGDGFSIDDVETLFWANPVAFYGQSGKLELDDVEAPAEPDLAATFAGNSILRGARA